MLGACARGGGGPPPPPPPPPHTHTFSIAVPRSRDDNLRGGRCSRSGACDGPALVPVPVAVLLVPVREVVHIDNIALFRGLSAVSQRGGSPSARESIICLIWGRKQAEKTTTKLDAMAAAWD